MAHGTEFVYHNIELYKSESLGSGSYGGVCKAKCDGLLCAAKIMHPTLFDRHDPGTDSYLRKFQEECHLLSLARHPNIVQYLATYYDPDAHLPVLLMELCNESLTVFLERSPEPLSYHIQLNICHDIALALVYLHSNGLIHRDLTGNNVLMISGPQAKITDFGMSKLATVNPRMTALTLCPGNALYMSPEALDASKSYTAKLDVFSFGVIVIQIVTRLFPNPTDRFREDLRCEEDEDDEEVRVVVPETERREAHLKLIPDTHSLKPFALQCLKKKERQRPSALELSERLHELKQSSQYKESVYQAQSKSEHRTQITELQRMVEDKERQLEEYQHMTQNSDGQLQEYQHKISGMERAVELKERELQQKQEQLRVSEQLVSELQQRLQQKDKTISDFQQTVSVHEREIQLLAQQDTDIGDQPQQQLVSTPRTATVAAAERSRDISKMTWRKGKSGPEDIRRGAAVVQGNTAYISPAASYKIFSYEIVTGEEQWSQLPDNFNSNCGLAIIEGLLTSVGGFSNSSFTNTLLSLTGEGVRRQWSEVFPPMPTPRKLAACITSEQALVVAGGYVGAYLDTVEVMNIDTKRWTTASSLPQKHSPLSGTLCEDTLYLAGGSRNYQPKFVFTCSIPDLMSSTNTLGSRVKRTLSRSYNIWKEISSPPLYSCLVQR